MRARQQPLLAAEALQAFVHVDPFARGADGELLATDQELELARVGALLRVEEITYARAQMKEPMSIHFIGKGPEVTPFKLEDGKG